MQKTKLLVPWLKNQNKKQQILFVVTQFYPPDYAPTGQLIQELASCLASPNNLVKVFTGQPGYAYKQKVAPPIEYANGIAVQRTRATQIWTRRIRGKLVNGILFFLRTGIFLFKNTKKGDKILFTTAPPFLPLLGYFLKKFKKISYSCLIYDLYPDVAVKLNVVSARNLLVKLWNFLNKKSWSKADQIIVLSSSMRQTILAKYPQFSQKISVIHNWADPSFIVPIAKAENWFAKKYDLVNKFTVLYSGNMGRCHDIETILEAAVQLQQEPIQFIFIGGGAEYKICLDTVEKWGLENCLFLPYQDREVLPYSLTACDLSLVSLKPGMEGIVAPSKFYSMLASGRPIAAICEKHSYLREIINQANCGIAVENGDGVGLSQFIRQMASNPELAKKLGQASRLYLLSNFTPEIIAQQYLKVLKLQPDVEPDKLIQFNFIQSNSNQGYLTKSIEQLLQELQLLTTEQVEDILHYQASFYPNLRFEEIAIIKGFLKKETVNYVLHYEKLVKPILRETHTLLTAQVNDILESQDNQLQFWELAVQKGWMKQNTINFLMETAKTHSIF